MPNRTGKIAALVAVMVLAYGFGALFTMVNTKFSNSQVDAFAAAQLWAPCAIGLAFCIWVAQIQLTGLEKQSRITWAITVIAMFTFLAIARG